MSYQRLCTQPRAWVPAAAAAAYTCHVSDLAREHQLGVTAAAGTVTDNVAYHMHASCVAPAAGLFTELWQWLSLPRCRCCCQLQCCCKCFKACHSATGILLPAFCYHWRCCCQLTQCFSLRFTSHKRYWLYVHRTHQERQLSCPKK